MSAQKNIFFNHLLFWYYRIQLEVSSGLKFFSISVIMVVIGLLSLYGEESLVLGPKPLNLEEFAKIPVWLHETLPKNSGKALFVHRVDGQFKDVLILQLFNPAADYWHVNLGQTVEVKIRLRQTLQLSMYARCTSGTKGGVDVVLREGNETAGKKRILDLVVDTVDDKWRRYTTTSIISEVFNCKNAVIAICFGRRVPQTVEIADIKIKIIKN